MGLLRRASTSEPGVARGRRRSLGLAWAAVLVVGAACNGDVNNSDFEGWVVGASSNVLRESEDGLTLEHLVHTARVPCRKCYFSLPSFVDHELVVRVTSVQGQPVTLKMKTEDLNKDLEELVLDTPPSIDEGDRFVLPSPREGQAGLYIGGAAADPGGVVRIDRSVWPQAPGDEGHASIDVIGASVGGRAIGGTLEVKLLMTREGVIPDGHGGVDQPCAGTVCDSGLFCVAEATSQMCRRGCGDPSAPACPPDRECRAFPGVGELCLPAAGDGERDAACGSDVDCSGELRCAPTSQRCTPVCETEGYDPVCGGSSRCRAGLCVPEPEPGLAHGPCRENRCDLEGLVCSAVSGTPLCRPSCTLEEADACGIGFSCELAGSDGLLCLPR